MKEDVVISIVVPVYNVEKYINRCVDSVLSQTFEEWELLLVNDGSTDRSGDLCDAYAQIDNRIQVFHSENRGVSHARNIALKNIKGKYITFLDADDWFDSICLEACICEIRKNNLDLFQFGSRRIDAEGKYEEVDRIETPVLHFKDLVKGKYAFSVTVWGSIFRSELIYQKTLFFSEGIKLGEDQKFLYEYLLYANRIKISSKVFYNYYINPKSATQTSNDIELLHVFDVFNYILNLNPYYEYYINSSISRLVFALFCRRSFSLEDFNNKVFVHLVPSYDNRALALYRKFLKKSPWFAYYIYGWFYVKYTQMRFLFNKYNRFICIKL